MACPTGNIPNRLCELETQVESLVLGAGHPPMTVTFSGSADSFDEETQTLNINNSDAPSVQSSAVLDDETARLAAVPSFIGQVGTQTTDPVNGNFSIWVAYGLSAGNWTLKVSSMGAQNQNNVTITGGNITGISDILIADGGTGASTKQAARVNLTNPPVVAVAGVVDWSLSGVQRATMVADTAFSFTNMTDGMEVTLIITPGGFAATFPGVGFPGGVTPTSSGAGSSVRDLYVFVKVGAFVLGRAHLNYAVAAYPV